MGFFYNIGQKGPFCDDNILIRVRPKAAFLFIRRYFGPYSWAGDGGGGDGGSF